MRLCRYIVTLLVALLPFVGNAQLNTKRVMEIGRNALYFEDYVLSIQYFNRVIDSKPFLHEPYFFRALAKYYLDDYIGAEEDLTMAIERNPYVSRCYQLRGLCRANLDSLSLAEADLRTAIKYDPQNPNLWQNLGMVAIQVADWERAAQVTDTLVLYSPRDGSAYLMRSQVAMYAGDTLHAIAMIDKALQYDKYSPDVYETRAAIYFGRGDYEAAEKDIDKAIDLLPARGRSYLNRALVRYYRGNLRGAMEDYDMSIYVEPTNFVAYYNRGLLRMNVGDDNRAIEDFDKVLEIDPDNTMARFNRGLLREIVGDYKGAVSDYSKVIESYPNFEYAYECRASANRKAGNKKAAAADEKWLLKRRVDIYNNGIESVSDGEYSAENDKTRKRSDENVRNYNKMVVADDMYDKKYTTEYRGKVQNRNVFVELEPLFVLTYYSSDDEFAKPGYYFKAVEDLNAVLSQEQPLLLVNRERALAENEVARRFKHIDELSKSISDPAPGNSSYLLRAIDFYLLQDVESAMLDADRAVVADSLSWEPYFVRSFIRYKLLETEKINEVEKNDDAALAIGKAALPDMDYRKVEGDINKVLELMPGFAIAYYNRANVYAKLNDYKAAIVDYTTAIELNGGFAEAYYNRGLARIYIGNTKDGITDLSKAGELGLFQAYNVIKRFQYRGDR